MKFSAIFTILSVGACLSQHNISAFAPSFHSNNAATTTTVVPGAVLSSAMSPLFKTASSALNMADDTDESETEITVSSEDGEAPRQEKKPKKKKTPPPVVEVVIDVSKLDIRVGVINKAWEHEEADKLFCEEIDIGEESGPRQIASGLKAHYNVGDLEGRKVLVLSNLKTRKLVGFPSHGMVLCAVNDDEKVVFVDPPEGAVIGERVMVEGFDGEPAGENQVIKKKMLDAIFPDLKTNDNGIATYRGKPLATSAGNCKASLSNAAIS